VILLALDLDGRITLLNRKGYALLEWGDGQLIGREWIQTCLPVRIRNAWQRKSRWRGRFRRSPRSVVLPCPLLHMPFRVDRVLSVVMRPKKQDDTGFLTRVPRMLEGDIVVTRVARHYALGRMTADLRTQAPVDTQNARSDALRMACLLAGADHRVFLYELAGGGNSVRINCESVDKPCVHGIRRLKTRSR
jgi:hypothetical protein